MVDLQTLTCEFSNCGIRCVDEGWSEDQTAEVARRMAMIATALRATVRFTIISFRNKRWPNENSAPIFEHFKRNTQKLNLIRFEVAVRRGKICHTAPMLAAPLNRDKPKLFEVRTRRDADKATLLKK